MFVSQFKSAETMSSKKWIAVLTVMGLLFVSGCDSKRNPEPEKAETEPKAALNDIDGRKLDQNRQDSSEQPEIKIGVKPISKKTLGLAIPSTIQGARITPISYGKSEREFGTAVFASAEAYFANGMRWSISIADYAGGYGTIYKRYESPVVDRGVELNKIALRGGIGFLAYNPAEKSAVIRAAFHKRYTIDVDIMGYTPEKGDLHSFLQMFDLQSLKQR